VDTIEQLRHGAPYTFRWWRSLRAHNSRQSSRNYTGERLLRQEHLVPLGSRIRTRLVTEAASREELLELLGHALSKAGNATLMTAELKDTLVDHSAGNYRLLMIMGAELLAYGMANDVSQLDEKCYLEVFQPKQSRPAIKKKVRV
jgi:hypothetical protein